MIVLHKVRCGRAGGRAGSTSVPRKRGSYSNLAGLGGRPGHLAPLDRGANLVGSLAGRRRYMINEMQSMPHDETTVLQRNAVQTTGDAA